MKRLFFTVIAAITMTTSLSANQQGHFFINVEDENVSVETVTNHFSSWLDLPAKTTFAKFRDETDNLGIRHISYQQMVDGREVNNGIVLVHAKNGKVFCVNGDIMDATIAAQYISNKITPIKAARKVRKHNPQPEDATLMIVKADINGQELYRYAYEVMAEDFTAKYYVDAETGDIIKSVPLVYNADVHGTATTMYNGTQEITCYEDNGKYFLIDNARWKIQFSLTPKTEVD